jgi:hypothetical protein
LDFNIKKIIIIRQIDGLAPTFLKKPSIRQEDDGKRLLFECLIKADPIPEVRWMHNTSSVGNDDRHKVRFIHLEIHYIQMMMNESNKHISYQISRVLRLSVVSSKRRFTILCLP